MAACSTSLVPEDRRVAKVLPQHRDDLEGQLSPRRAECGETMSESHAHNVRTTWFTKAQRSWQLDLQHHCNIQQEAVSDNGKCATEDL